MIGFIVNLNHLLYLTGIKNFSELDLFNSKYGLPFQDRIPDYADSCDHCIQSYNQYFLNIRDDLSYFPLKTRREMMSVAYWDIIYFRIGSQD